MKHITDQITLFRARRPWVTSLATLFSYLGGAVLLLESWEAALHPHAIGGFIIIISAWVLGKSPSEIGKPDVERRR